jgi:putative endonuclease
MVRLSNHEVGHAMAFTVYILRGADGAYYTGRTRRPIDLERQIKGWSRRKKEASIAGRYEDLPKLSRARPRGSTSSP